MSRTNFLAPTLLVASFLGGCGGEASDGANDGEPDAPVVIDDAAANDAATNDAATNDAATNDTATNDAATNDVAANDAATTDAAANDAATKDGGEVGPLIDSGSTGDGATATTYPECALPAGAVRLASAFGAKGDGTTDDTAALRLAIADLKSGGTLRLDAKKIYKISGTLAVTGMSNVAIDGNGSTLFMADGTPTDNHRLLNFSNSSKFVVTNLTLDGNRDGRVPAERSGAHAVGVSNSSDFAFCSVTAKNSTCDGFYLSGDKTLPETWARRGVFRNVVADNNYRQGMSIINANDIKILGGAYINTHGTNPEAGIDLEPNDGSVSPGINDILVRGVRFEGNAGTGLTGGGPVKINRITVEDSMFINNGLTDGTGFRLGFMNSLVQNNTFTKHGTNITIQLVQFRGSADTNNVVMRGNTFTDNTTTVRLIEIGGTGPNTFLVDNVFTKNTSTIAINTHSVTTTCIAGNSINGTLDRPAGSCGTLPAVGYAP